MKNLSLISIFNLSWLYLLFIPSSTVSLPEQVNRANLQPNELVQLQETMQRDIDSVLGLAGLGKSALPSPYSPELENFRQTWSALNPETAPFLGLWVNEWEMFPPYHSLSIFPSQEADKLCLVERTIDYSQGLSVDAPNLVSVTFNFSTIRFSGAQGWAYHFQLHPTLIVQTQDYNYSSQIEFLGTVSSTKELKLYTSKTIPQVDSDWPQEIWQEFSNHQCREKKEVEE